MKLIPVYIILIACVLLAACRQGAPATASPEQLTGTAIAEGNQTPLKIQELYERKCASCHGDDGTAGIGGAANLRRSRKTMAEITVTITHGQSAMPAFKGQLTAAELSGIAAYVVNLRQ